MRPESETVSAGKGDAIKAGLEDGQETMRPCTMEKTWVWEGGA